MECVKSSTTRIASIGEEHHFQRKSWSEKIYRVSIAAIDERDAECTKSGLYATLLIPVSTRRRLSEV